VPHRAGLSEIHDLSAPDRAVLIEEVARASAALKSLTGAAKINVGALGNLVPQLHVHVVARNPGDPAWPGPVWGQGTAEPYEAAAQAAFIAQLRASL
jgi:diadenosine tetraphosphate (Ap4A) HIT family hydrolase